MSASVRTCGPKASADANTAAARNRRFIGRISIRQRPSLVEGEDVWRPRKLVDLTNSSLVPHIDTVRRTLTAPIRGISPGSAWSGDCWNERGRMSSRPASTSTVVQLANVNGQTASCAIVPASGRIRLQRRLNDFVAGTEEFTDNDAAQRRADDIRRDFERRGFRE